MGFWILFYRREQQIIYIGYMSKKRYMLHESILNAETFDAPVFKMEGGFSRFDKKFAGKLNDIIERINTYIFEGVA